MASAPVLSSAQYSLFPFRSIVYSASRDPADDAAQARSWNQADLCGPRDLADERVPWPVLLRTSRPCAAL